LSDRATILFRAARMPSMNGAGEDSVKRSRAVASIPLCALADEAKAFQRNTRQIDGLRGDVETMDRGRMGDDHLDNVDVDPEGYRSGASLGPHLVVVDQFADRGGRSSPSPDRA